MKTMTSKASGKPEEVFSMKKMLEQIGVYEAQIILPRKLIQDKPLPQAVECSLVLRTTSFFMSEAKKQGDVVIHGRVYDGENGQHILLVRVQAGPALAALAVDIADPEFMELLDICGPAGRVPLVCMSPSTHDMQIYALQLEAEDTRQVMEDARRCPRLNDEDALIQMAMATAWLHKHELVSMEPGVTVTEATLSVVTPSVRQDSAPAGMALH